MTLDILTVILSSVGLLFFVGGSVGLLRFPDLYTRLHPVTMADTLGASSILIALLLRSGLTFDSLKIVLIFLFLLLSGATCSHAIGRSALYQGIEPAHRPGTIPWPADRPGGSPTTAAESDTGESR